MIAADAESAVARRAPTDADVPIVRALLRRGLTIDAWREIEKLTPPETWGAGTMRRIAASVCSDLGAPKRAQALRLGIVRREPKSAAARLERLAFIARVRGSIACYRALVRERFDDATDEERFEAQCFEVGLLGSLRDFTIAREKLAPLLARSGEDAYRARFMAAGVAQQQDRYEEMLSLAEEARAFHRDDDDAIGLVSLARLLNGDRRGAIELLEEGCVRTQSPVLPGMLSELLREEKRHDERWKWLGVREERLVLAEDPEQLRCMRADCAYDRGEIAAARELLRGATRPFHATVARSLEAAAPDARRVVCDIPFVRQHHMTCAPATLTSIASFFGMPADHLEVAEKICYDGTPSHSQRKWAESQGFIVRELTVTADVTRALLDRGVPFTVAIVAANAAHLQAIVGYDDRRGTLMIRDPFVPVLLEAIRDEWLEEWRATGPRGMVIVPRERASLLDGIELPDATLHDDAFALQTALDAHDRKAAADAEKRLSARAPDHPITNHARRALAAYDEDPARVMTCAKKTAAAFPKFVPPQLDIHVAMSATASRADRIAFLEEARRTNDDPAFAEVLAMELTSDARAHDRVERLVAQTMRARPDRHQPVQILGAVARSRGRHDEALVLARFAACMGVFDESAALAYFSAARASQRAEEALAFLRLRAADLGKRRAGPVTTLAAALDSLDRTPESLAILDDAIAARSEDGELLLYAAHAFAWAGRVPRAKELLAAAKSHVEEMAWARVASEVALCEGDEDTRHALLERIVAARPLDASAHQALAKSVLARSGIAAARAHLERAWLAAPHHRGLAHAFLAWHASLGAAKMEDVARRVLAVEGTDLVASRVLVEALVEQKRPKEARAAFDAMKPIDVNADDTIRAEIELLAAEGRDADARARSLQMLENDADDAALIHALYARAASANARREVLFAVQGVVGRRSVTGAGLLAWYSCARTLVHPPELMLHVESLHRSRGDLWAAHTSRARHHLVLGQKEEAARVASAATERFPHVSEVWLALADVHAATGRRDRVAEALERAVWNSPLETRPVIALARAQEAAGDLAAARALLARAVRLSPGAPNVRIEHARLLWQVKERDLATSELRAALALDAEHGEAWALFDEWSEDDKAASLVAIEAIAAERPWSSEAQLNLARAKLRNDDPTAALAVVAKAIETDPANWDAYDLRASIYASMQRWDDALEACSPPGAKTPPRTLAGRRAWIVACSSSLKDGIALMREVVTEHDDYVWAWHQLAAFGREAKDAALTEWAARKVTVLDPSFADGHLLLAKALEARGDRAGAIEALETTASLAPLAISALGPLFEFRLDEDIAVAEALLPRLRNADETFARGCAVKLHAKKRDRAACIESLESLLVDPNATAAQVSRAIAAALPAFPDDAARALRARTIAPDCPAPVARAWAAELGRGFSGKLADEIAAYPAGPGRDALAAVWVDSCARGRQLSQCLPQVRRWKKEGDETSDTIWWLIGYVLRANGLYTECVDWMKTWAERKGATAAMLLDAAIAMRETGADAHAFRVVRHATTLPRDAASASHHKWLAYELLLRDDVDGAHAAYGGSAVPRYDPYLQALDWIVNAMFAAKRARGVDRSRSFRDARRWMASAGPTTFRRRGSKVIERAFDRASDKIARDIGGVGGKAWRHRSLLIRVGIIAAVWGLTIFVGAAFDDPSGAALLLTFFISLFTTIALAAHAWTGRRLA